MAKNKAYYLFNNLKTACKFTLSGKVDVIIKQKAFNDAKSIFGIKNKAELLQAIINLNKSDRKFIKTKKLEKTSEIPPPTVDSYWFVFKLMDGYLAFYCSKDTGKWVLKSFKKYDDKYEPFENEIGRQLREYGLI